MTKIFTKDDMVRYIYGETSQNENILIEILLTTDPELRHIYHQLNDMKREIEEYEVTPSPAVIEKILDYSRYSKDLHSISG